MERFDPAAYDSWYSTAFGSLCHRLEKDALFSLAKFQPGEKVLDAGCGTGVYIEEMLRLDLEVTGVDEDEGMLRYAAGSRGRGAPLVKSPITGLPFGSATFDKVVSVCTLEFIKDMPAALRELSRVLKTDGVLILGFLNRNSPWAKLRIDKGKNAGSIWHGAKFYTLSEICGAATNIGLQITGFKCAVHFPPESEGQDIRELTAIESDAALHSPSSAAFIAAAFVKSPSR